jgi:hypothetical protein
MTLTRKHRQHDQMAKDLSSCVETCLYSRKVKLNAIFLIGVLAEDNADLRSYSKAAFAVSQRPSKVAFASILTRKLQRLNLLRHVFQVRCESIRNLARIISRLRDVIAHL